MEKNRAEKINGLLMHRILSLVVGAILVATVMYVLFRQYDPAANTIEALSSVSMDIICMIVLYVLIFSVIFGKYDTNRSNIMYAMLLMGNIWALFLDFLNWAFDGRLQWGNMTALFTVGSLCMGAILAGLFSIYLSSYLEENYNLTQVKKHGRNCALFNLVSFGVTFILAITGTAFEFVDGHYKTGPLYDVITVIPIVTILLMAGLTVRYVKVVGVHDVLAIAGYVVIMITGALIEAENGIGTSYVGVAVANIFIFALLQNQVIAKAKKNAQKWMAISNTDELTGFYNRHAYEYDLKLLENGKLDEDFVYVSMDVNSLKVVNDSRGHQAGDELIVGAAKCLENSLGEYGKLYRIGGDEFAAMIFAEPSILEKIKKDINQETEKWNGILNHRLTISCGYVTRREFMTMTIKQMAVLADRRMYAAKKAFYSSELMEKNKTEG